VTWADAAIGLLLLFGTFKGFRRGLINELTGLVALAFGLAAAFFYRGMWDGWLIRVMHVAPGAAHVAGMFAYGAVAYTVVLILGGALSTVARLPLIGLANALLGAVVGLAKSAAFAWAILYVALFFPLSPAIRHDLRGSALVQLLQRPNEGADARLRASIPEAIRPYSESLFAQHHLPS
jgi:uncharacterized membrane protein required for colicin V production